MKHLRELPGQGKLLIFVYALFALAATARASVQIISDWQQAPLAFTLSAVAGLIYLIAAIALAHPAPAARVIAWTAVGIEMIGVLSVGLLSVFSPELFPQASVWSHFGQGYGYVPLVLPVFGLLWLRQRSRN